MGRRGLCQRVAEIGEAGLAASQPAPSQRSGQSQSAQPAAASRLLKLKQHAHSATSTSHTKHCAAHSAQSSAWLSNAEQQPHGPTRPRSLMGVGLWVLHVARSPPHPPQKQNTAPQCAHYLTQALATPRSLHTPARSLSSPAALGSSVRIAVLPRRLHLVLAAESVCDGGSTCLAAPQSESRRDAYARTRAIHYCC